MRALRHLAVRWLEQEVTVPINSCVHYAGFRYGCGDYHPYESYVIEQVQSGRVEAARARLVHFLQHYRPRHLGEGLGVTLGRDYPLWFYPWLAEPPAPAWRPAPADCPDIITHFSPRGIPWPRIHAEFDWLERALRNIREHGYQPERFGSPIQVRCLERTDHTTAHLVLDGNHRLGALAALGHREVRVRLVPRHTVREANLAHWPQVKNGGFTPEDARGVLQAFFEGNHRPETTREPAALLDGGIGP